LVIEANWQAAAPSADTLLERRVIEQALILQEARERVVLRARWLQSINICADHHEQKLWLNGAHRNLEIRTY